MANITRQSSQKLRILRKHPLISKDQKYNFDVLLNLVLVKRTSKSVKVRHKHSKFCYLRCKLFPCSDSNGVSSVYSVLNRNLICFSRCFIDGLEGLIRERKNSLNILNTAETEAMFGPLECKVVASAVAH